MARRAESAPAQRRAAARRGRWRADPQRGAALFALLPALLPLAAALSLPLSLSRHPRCFLSRGTWCDEFHAQPPLPAGSWPVHATPCPRDCGGVGVCHADTGRCDCPAGWGGPDCSTPDKRPCTNRFGGAPGSPFGHINADGTDLDWRAPGHTPSRCTGVCDADTATCYCGGNGKHARAPAPPGAPPGAPPLREGRLLAGRCQRVRTDAAGVPLSWVGASGMPYETIYGPQGWCVADRPIVRCDCSVDGYAGPTCEDRTEAFCPNQCSGRGECERGWCRCARGWYGADCARRAAWAPPDGDGDGGAAGHASGKGGSAAAATPPPPPLPSSPQLPVWRGAAPDGGAALTSFSGDDGDGGFASVMAAAAAAAADGAAPPPVPPHLLTVAEWLEPSEPPPRAPPLVLARPWLADVAVDPWARGWPRAANATAAGGGGGGGGDGSGGSAGPPAAAAAAGAAAASAAPANAAPAAAQAAGAQGAAAGGAAASAAAALAVAERASGGDRPAESSGPVTAAAAAVADAAGLAEAAGAAVGGGGAGTADAADAAAVNSASAAVAAADAATAADAVTAAGADAGIDPPKADPAAAAPAAPPISTARRRRSLLHYFRIAGGALESESASLAAAADAYEEEEEEDGGGKEAAARGGSWTDSVLAVDESLEEYESSQAAIAAGRANGGAGSGGSGSSGGSDETGGGGGGGGGGDGDEEGESAKAKAALSEAEAELAEAGGSDSRSLEAAPAAPSTAAGASADGETPGKPPPPPPPLPARRRPLVFVYDMPAPFVARLLQFRSDKAACTWRLFGGEGNGTTFTGSAWPYALESFFHEALLQSPHRTLDPDEADLFFVPVYASCLIEAVVGHADAPWYPKSSPSRVQHGALLYAEALDWLRSAYPYWNRSQGRDHVWLFTHDEGACWAPAEVYRNSIILTQYAPAGQPAGAPADPSAAAFGAAGPPPSATARREFNYSIDVRDPQALPFGWVRGILGHPCYDPEKDIVLPAFRPPAQYHAAAGLGGMQRSRDILLLLRGDTGAGRPPEFSGGLRQEVARLARQLGWAGRYSVRIGSAAEIEGDYSMLLSRSTFCLVLPADGWSGLFEEAVLHGCVPVLVTGPGARRLLPPFADQFDWDRLAVAVDRSNLARLPQILGAVEPQRLAEMQRRAARMWVRLAWLDHPAVVRQAAAVMRRNFEKYPWIAEEQAKLAVWAAQGRLPDAVLSSGARLLRRGDARDDAFSTVMQVLAARARALHGGGGAAAAGAPSGAAGAAAGPTAVERRQKRRRRRWRRRHAHYYGSSAVSLFFGGSEGSGPPPTSQRLRHRRTETAGATFAPPPAREGAAGAGPGAAGPRPGPTGQN
ncbi:hypothetical protein Rsub_05212 [Raphidocelis subcapitata]|uniref:EGF-like domain-containing protein n=1 Tax=Raphidocelis subcapitata TaxID=307507 RepID=A0A2V0NY81_9CHLO|nr:hypothetical protein Rsub_05212 [Raphidocelis subcapitata]|eukprot:GBF92598.1 hypothetical protein Rsub_05212 [Raphidocelis subcapitata]